MDRRERPGRSSASAPARRRARAAASACRERRAGRGSRPPRPGARRPPRRDPGSAAPIAAAGCRQATQERGSIGRGGRRAVEDRERARRRRGAARRPRSGCGSPAPAPTAAYGTSSRFVRARTRAPPRRRDRAAQAVSSRRARATSSPGVGREDRASRRLAGDAPMRFSKRSSLCATRRAARWTISGAQRWLVSRSTRRRPGSGPRARGPAARRRGATRRWSGRRRRRGRCRARHRPAGGRARAGVRSRSWASSTKSIAAAGAPARQQARVGASVGAGHGHEVVEVEGAACARARPGSPRRPACVATSLRRWTALRVELQAGEGVVEPGAATVPAADRRRGLEDARAARRWRSTSTPASARMSRPSAWNVPTRTLPAATPSSAERRVDALLQLLGGATIEGQRRRSAAGSAPVRDAPADARHDRRRLARAGRGDAQDGPGRGRGSGALVGHEAGEPLVDSGMHGHVSMVAGSPCPGLIPAFLRAARGSGTSTSIRPVTPQLETTLANLPDQPGVYLMKDAQGRVLYVGKAQSLRNRVRQYWQAGRGSQRAAAHRVGHRPGRRRREHADRHGQRGAAPRGQPRQALPAALQRPTQGRQVLPVHQGHPGRRLPAHRAHAQAAQRRQPLLRAVRLGEQRRRGDEPHPAPLPVPHLHASTSARASAPSSDPACCTTSSAARAPASRPSTRTTTAPTSTRSCSSSRATRSRSRGRCGRRWRPPRTASSSSAPPRCATRCGPSSGRWRARRWPASRAASSTCWATPAPASEAAVQLFAIRDGKTVSRDVFLLENLGDGPDDEALTAFVKQYYATAGSIPPRVLVPFQPRRPPSSRRSWPTVAGSRVAIAVPQRGEGRALMALAARNAAETLAREQARWLADEGKTLRRPRGAGRCAGPAGAADAHRVLRHQHHPGHVHRGQHGRVRGRPAAQRRVPPLPDPHGRGPQDDFASHQEVLRRRFRRALVGGGGERRAAALAPARPGHHRRRQGPGQRRPRGARRARAARPASGRPGQGARGAVPARPVRPHRPACDLAGAVPACSDCATRRTASPSRTTARSARQPRRARRSTTCRASGRRASGPCCGSSARPRQLRGASVDEIAAVPGISRGLAERIREYLET